MPTESTSCDPPRGYRGPFAEPWAQKRLALTRVHQFTRGEGVTAAVIDSGADARHPMLAGRVTRAIDLTGTGPRDCVGHGTGVAALIAGHDLSDHGIPLSGVAPAARLLIVKQQNADRDENGGDRLPGAIRRAADAGARVINVSIQTRPSPALDRAVRYAQAHDAVIVAAAGNATKSDGGEAPAYPATYPGVISVASLGIDGGRAETSGLRSRVDVGAPGRDLTVPWPDGGYDPRAQGTSYAAAYVSGVATLVRARHPGLTQDQVVRRVLATADGNAGPGTGRGMVNPMQAVTAVVPGEKTSAASASSRTPAPAALATPAPADHGTRARAITFSAGAVGLAGAVALCGVIVPLGRRRGWRPGKATLAEGTDEDEPVITGADDGTIGAKR